MWKTKRDKYKKIKHNILITFDSFSSILKSKVKYTELKLLKALKKYIKYIDVLCRDFSVRNPYI